MWHNDITNELETPNQFRAARASEGISARLDISVEAAAAHGRRPVTVDPKPSVAPGEVAERHTAAVEVDGALTLGWSVRAMTEEELAAYRGRMKPLSKAQFAIAVAGAGVITPTEAADWVKGDRLPEFAVTAIAALPREQRDFAEIRFYSVGTIGRNNPLVEMLRQAAGVTAAQLDAIFEQGATL